jgi:hypothetical protein
MRVVKRRRYIVESHARVGPAGSPVRHFTRAVWAVSEADVRRVELLRLVEIPGSKSQAILSVELDPHAS